MTDACRSTLRPRGRQEPVAVGQVESDRAVTTSAGRSPRAALLAAGLGLVTVASYLVGAGSSYDYDSSVTVGLFVSNRNWAIPLTQQRVFNNHVLFSMLSWCIWHLGGRGEAAMRVAPILMAGATVVVVTSWASRRWSLGIAALAGLLVAANPMFATLSRSVRGYSMAVLAITIATLLLIDDLDAVVDPTNPRPPWGPHTTRARRVLYVIAMAVAIGTRFDAGVALACHGAAIVAVRGEWRRRWRTLLWAGVLGCLPLAFTLADMMTTLRLSRGIFHAAFPWDVVRLILGGTALSVAIAVVLIATGTRGRLEPRRSIVTPRRAATAVLVGILSFEWLVSRSNVLDARFVLWLVPLGALGLASLAAHGGRPARALGALLVAVMVIGQMSTWAQPTYPLREAGAWIAQHRGERTVCADGASREAFLAYGDPMYSLTNAREIDNCDIVVQVGAPSIYHVMPAVRRRYAHHIVFHAGTDVVIYTGRR